MSVAWSTIKAARQRLKAEQGAVVSDWGGQLPFAIIYPNRYHTGMSSLGLQAVYHTLNDMPGVLCERAFVDSVRAVQRDGLVSIESQRELSDFALLGFSLSYELDYWNALAALRAGDIPLRSQDRDERHPLIIGGGPAVTANPEPLAPFLDCVVVGEAEVILPELVAVVAENTAANRPALLKRLAALPGVYVPSQFETQANGAGPPPRPIDSGVSVPVRRQWLADLDSAETCSHVLTRDTEFGDMFLVELSRGCGRGCRFCLAGRCYLPSRERSVESVLAMAERGLVWRPRIGLVSAAVSDYSHMDELLDGLAALGAQISVSSLRADSVSTRLLSALASSGDAVTLAPEVGSDRLSQLVGKRLWHDEIVRASEQAAALGMSKVKLYFMVGLPGETDADLRGIIDLTVEVQHHAQLANPGCRVSVNLAPFVPKAHTAFQRVPMCRPGDLGERMALVRRGLSQHHIPCSGEHPAWSAVQGVLARGDRRLAPVLETMSEQPSLAAWRGAMERAGLSDEHYLYRHRTAEEALPWSVVAV